MKIFSKNSFLLASTLVVLASILLLKGMDGIRVQSVMAVTEMEMLALGDSAPGFSLPDVVTGETISLETFADKKALLVMSLCRSCPYVKHVIREVAQLGRDYEGQDIGITGFSANDSGRFPADAPNKLKEMAQELDFTFPLLYDESQEVAKAYTAAYTPDFFLFDEERKLVYRGQFDSTRPGSQEPVTGKDLRQAIDALLAGNPVGTPQTPSFGCSIKWKTGNAPTYAR